MIPLFVIEEHHEAFIAWNYAIYRGFISPQDNTLLHVDEHSDMNTPRFNQSILTTTDLTRFTYSELNIASFIIPACYLGIFNKIYWIRQTHTQSRYSSRKMYVRSYNQNGKFLISGKAASCKDVVDEDKKLFDYYLRSIYQMPTSSKVVLDIDLDFFSCTGNPNLLDEIYVEITESEFESFISNKYNRLNYCNIGRIESIKKDGKFYYVINNYNEVYPESCKVSVQEIGKRIDEFIAILRQKKINPAIICICRSRHSGYTPDEQWAFIESTLTSKLNELYVLKNYTLPYDTEE